MNEEDRKFLEKLFVSIDISGNEINIVTVLNRAYQELQAVRIELEKMREELIDIKHAQQVQSWK